ncbi:hypothetical protein B0H34DRAFT_792246 [Crassisporium funariophilum]|nr:hypothetical protein B0H34DRAFT_792246 [Crassisporium funariophilum]
MSHADNPSPSDNLTATSRLPKQKLNALARLKSFGETFVHRRPPPVVFPPPSWDLDDEALDAAAKKTKVALPESNFEKPVAADGPPEALSFARKLRALIESLPVPGTASYLSTSASAVGPAETDEGKQGSPVPPGMDAGMVRMLSSEHLMNGQPDTPTNDKEGARLSVWNILASLKATGGQEGSTHAPPVAIEEEEGGVMMYAPLEPNNDSQLELAKSETFIEYVDDTKTGSPEEKRTETGDSSDKPAGDALHAVEKRVWVPSTTQLSLLTTWWGYRLYLPPPVMAKLDKTSLKATARAAMITAALKWLLDKIPMMIVPPQLRPAVKMLKMMSPVVSYIGVFIAWSWDRVRACDTGNGVVLTATWLLPVALLPMAWDAGDIHGPRMLKPEEMEAAAAAAAAASEAASKPVPEDKSSDQTKPGDKGKQKEETKRSIFRW